MTEPDPRAVPAEDLDEKGVDRVGLERTLREINGAVAEVAEQMRLLGDRVVTGSSGDGQVTVWITAAGQLKSIRLGDRATRDLASLGERIARTIRDLQRRARADYEDAVRAIEQPEFVVTERGVRRAPGARG